jgi:glyoxylase-like metal-dependent hydrolase (beta-lactamase superfamily II)
MSLLFETFVLGPLDNNTYLLWDDGSNMAVVIDPSFEPYPVIECIGQLGIKLQDIWLTHAHFDHFVGIPEIQKKLGSDIGIQLHRLDLDLYQSGGLASSFGLDIPDLPMPTKFLTEQTMINVGEFEIRVLATPGHCKGHVCFYSPDIGVLFTGDLIFKQGVGRTDFPGANQDDLLKSIYLKVLTLPEGTILLPGHGESTSVHEEIEFNPYLN